MAANPEVAVGLAARVDDLLFAMMRGAVPELPPAYRPEAPLGYWYPAAWEAVGTEVGAEIEILEDLRFRHFLVADLFDTVLLCPQCSRADLQIIRGCPSCHAETLQRGETLFHRACGRVALERDFLRGIEYVCPHCQQRLGARGADYERTDPAYACTNCGQLLLEPTEECRCLHCRQVFRRSMAEERRLYVYRLNPDVVSPPAARSNLPLDPGVYRRERVVEPFSGLARLDYFLAQVRKEISRGRRQDSTFAVLLLRLDGFTALQERRGRTFAGRLLSTLGRELRSQLRESDAAAVYRWGEYAIFLPATDARGATAAAEKLVTRIRSWAGDRAREGGEPLLGPAGATVGLALFPADGANCEDLLRRATRLAAHTEPVYAL
jgi:diguanylate cyclase (GGDEF)-like protein